MIYPLIKRGFDILVSGIMILLLSPLLLAAAIAVKLTSPGPILFKQTRGGRNSTPFQSLKFRSMRTDHVHDPTEYMPLTHEGITPIGKLLRRTKVDELPQLFNVLCGDMSLVGPRPTIMDQVNAYDDFKRRRLEVRPGITGLAQVNGNASIEWDERIKYDVYYVDHMSMAMDVMILFKTCLVIILGETSYVRPFEQSPYAQRGRS